MKYDVTHILTSLKKECQRYGKGHVKIRKMERKKDPNLFITVGSCI
jgi:phosphodiesterase/alkaline phosphatase D-like protein